MIIYFVYICILRIVEYKNIDNIDDYEVYIWLGISKYEYFCDLAMHNN